MEDSCIYYILSKQTQTNNSCPPAAGQSGGQQLKNVTHGLDKIMVKNKNSYSTKDANIFDRLRNEAV
jgi:hypothetical protein